MSPTTEGRLLEKLEDIDVRLARLEAKFDERSAGVEVRVSTLERKAWAAVTGLVIAMTSLLATGAATFVNFFTGK